MNFNSISVNHLHYFTARGGRGGRGRGAPRGPRAASTGAVTATARIASRAAYIKRCAAKGVTPDQGLICDDSGFGEDDVDAASTPTKKAVIIIIIFSYHDILKKLCIL